MKHSDGDKPMIVYLLHMRLYETSLNKLMLFSI